MSTARARLLVLLACLAAAALAVWRAQPPAPVAADADGRAFSAMRARARLEALLGDGAPHPVGSVANAEVRARLRAQLLALGLAVEEQAVFSCSETGNCAPVVNLIARVPGQAAGPALLLASHYDSVPAGPGAADDGHGVALMLEVLRALLVDGPPAGPLLAVFTDGEEAGLLGARAFVEHPAFAGVAEVINVEARGTGGAARMFETSDGNAGLVARYAAGVGRPSALSLSYEVYRRLPNDTDLSVFKRAGAQGLNFAFIGGVRRYHTPLDDLAHLDLGSVQQGGDAVLGAARALLAGPPEPAAANASYADVFGVVLLRWPAALDLPLAGLALLLGLAAAIVAARRGLARARAIAAGACGAVLAPLLGAGGAFAALWVIEAASGPKGTWPAAMMTTLLAAPAAAASAVVVLALRPVARRVGALAQALGVWLVWSLLAVAVAVVMPGASILWIAPAVLAGVGLLAAAVRPGLLGLACAGGGALALALWAPLVPGLVEALGLNAIVIGALVGWIWGVLTPTLAEMGGERDARALGLGLGFAAAVLGLLAVRDPLFTADLPGKLSILHVQDLDGGGARHVLDAAADELPPAIAGLAAWEVGPALPWTGRALPVAPAAAVASDGPSLQVTSSAAQGELRRVTGTLRARPGARYLIVVLPATGLVTLRLGGRSLDPAKLKAAPSDRRMLTIYGPPAAGVEVVAELSGAAPWTLADGVAALPAASAPLVQARPPDRVPYQVGDLAVALRSVTP